MALSAEDAAFFAENCSSKPKSRGISPISIGCIDNPNATKLRIVHISDTHLEHNKYLDHIPNGDIFIHSGDFGHLSLTQFICRESDYTREIEELDKFFGKLPHKYKIFVAGNHETNFSHHRVTKTQSLLHSGIYLQDSSVLIEGVKFYGSPWNGLRSESYARGFAVPYPDLDNYWTNIPEDVDVLITHQPATQLLDFGRLRKGSKKEYHCELCDTPHGNGFFHLGCPDLRRHIMDRIRPKLHCFGHVHEDNGTMKENDILFSNAAMKLQTDPFPNVIDLYTSSEVKTDLTPVNYRLETAPKTCSIQ